MKTSQNNQIKGSKSVALDSQDKQKDNLGKVFNFVFDSQRRKPNDLALKLGKKELSFPGRQDICKKILLSLKKETKAISENNSPEFEKGRICKIIE